MKLRGFWNDPQGITVSETLELIVALMYLVGGSVELRQLILGKLTSTGVDLLTVLTWPVLAILGGGIVQRFGWPRVRGMGMNDYWNIYPTPPVSPSEPVDGNAGMGGAAGTGGPI